MSVIVSPERLAHSGNDGVPDTLLPHGIGEIEAVEGAAPGRVIAADVIDPGAEEARNHREIASKALVIHGGGGMLKVLCR
jgi:hypothetical protein